jgi:hypothetical protein
VCSLVTLSKYYSTKNKTLLAGSIGQRLLDIFTALSPFDVEQPHDKGSALYIPALLQDTRSGTQSNFTYRRSNEVMTFPYKVVQQRSYVALCSPLGEV